MTQRETYLTQIPTTKEEYPLLLLPKYNLPNERTRGNGYKHLD